MVEKKLRKDIDETVLELTEIAGELGRRFGLLKKFVKPSLFVVAGLIALKIAFAIARAVLCFLWSHKIMVVVLMTAAHIGYNKFGQVNQETS